MRIALLKPPIGGILGLEMLTFVEPLGLEYLVGALEPEGHDCLVLDLRIDGEDAGLEACRRHDPDLVGIQCNFTTERNRAMRVARRVRGLLPEAFILLGGHDASRSPEWFLQPPVDAVAIGDGESVLPELVRALEEGRALGSVPGMAFRDGDEVRETSPAERIDDLDELPLPARASVSRYADRYYINYRKPLALLETARGCPYRCTFCSVWQFHGTRFRYKSPERVVQELAAIDAPNVFITDDIFWLDADRGWEMARQIQAAGIRKYFTVQTRTDLICRHPDLVEAWKGCGDLAIFLGVEKVDDEGLRALNKRSRADANVRALEILKEIGVGFTSNFIVDPDWQSEDFARLKAWLRVMGAYNSGFSVLTPLPGTLLWNDVKDEVTTDDWEMFDIVHTVLPTRLPLEEFYREYADLWAETLRVRYAERGRARTWLQLAAALATGKVSPGAIRKGMNIARVFSDPETFLAGHRRPA